MTLKQKVTFSDELVEFIRFSEGFRVQSNGSTIGYGFDHYLRPDIKINYLDDGVSISRESRNLFCEFLLRQRGGNCDATWKGSC